jgi:cytochrome b561
MFDAMGWRNTPRRYGWLGQGMHWLVVAGIIALYFTAEAAEGDGDGMMALHNSLGIAILALAALRLVWRLADRPPALPDTMARWQRTAARAAHALLYALLFALPVSGWLLSSAEGDPVLFFGWFELPPLPGAADADMMEEVHEVLFNVLLAVAILHAAAALKHHFWDRDDVLRSMLPGGEGRRNRGIG